MIDVLQKNKVASISILKKQIKNNQKIYQDKQYYLIEIERSMNEYSDLIKKYEKLLKIGHSTYDEVNVTEISLFSAEIFI